MHTVLGVLACMHMLSEILCCACIGTCCLPAQMVVVSEPRIVAELLHNTSLAKPTQPVMVHFRQVSLTCDLLLASVKMKGCVMRGSFQHLYSWALHPLQLMSPHGRADFLSAEGDSEDWLWRTVRRGVAPAFAPKALRCLTRVHRDYCQHVCRRGLCKVLYATCHSHSLLFRAAYPKVAQVGAHLTKILQSRPQHEAIDMCNVCMCETIDALGLAGFNKAFNSIEAIAQGQQADLLHVRLPVLVCNLYVMCVSHKRVLCKQSQTADSAYFAGRSHALLPSWVVHICPSMNDTATLVFLSLSMMRLCIWTKIFACLAVPALSIQLELLPVM